MNEIDKRLAELGIELAPPAKPVANYVGWVRTGNLVFTAGQITLKDGNVEYKGKVGKDFTVEEGAAAARICATNILAQLKDACGGDLTRVKRIVKLVGFVNGTPEFVDHPKVINGASDLMVEVLGEAGRHARAAVSVPSLPLGVAVEIDAVFELA